MDVDNYTLILDEFNSNDFDLVLESDVNIDFRKGSLYNNLITDDLVFYYDFAVYPDYNNIFSLVNYNNKKTSGFTIYDIGLCGVDTGYVQNLTGETITYDTGSTLVIKPVTGLTNMYDLNFTQNININKKVLNFNGGFYQGFYKLDGYFYEMIPNRTEEGFNLNFWLNRKSGNTTNLPSDNFFFFMGTRAENKFYNSFSGETGITTSSNILLSTQTSGTTDVNGIGFYYNEGYLGFKQVINRQDTSGNTSVSIFNTGKTFIENLNNPWLNVSINFKRNLKLEKCDECDCLIPEPIIITTYDSGCTQTIPDTQLGKLQIFINGRPLFDIEIEESIFRALIVDKDVQQGVPYNISIGGGTLGLLESQTFDGPDLSDQNLFMYNNFAGSFIGEISVASMYSRPLTIPEIINNFNSQKEEFNIVENFGGPKIIVNDNFIK